ncbi:hypothetical protein ACIG3E_33605 [Streptomyces sp. NPDC053474]|uniref:hypothetical protein n=1 Tax=Streptomyces sp. NPDC053474 TaxID=3365704 RepID=UPI0037D6DBFA
MFRLKYAVPAAAVAGLLAVAASGPAAAADTGWGIAPKTTKSSAAFATSPGPGIPTGPDGQADWTITSHR